MERTDCTSSKCPRKSMTGSDLETKWTSYTSLRRGSSWHARSHYTYTHAHTHYSSCYSTTTPRGLVSGSSFSRRPRSLLRARVRDGFTNMSRIPWSSLISSADIWTEGRVLTARMRTENPSIWLRIVATQDSLFQHR
jgi:hypothetical protein